MEAGKNAIDHLVRTLGPANIYSVQFTQVRLDLADQSVTLADVKKRIKVIKQFLVFTGIPENRIKITDLHLR
jgi:hypothetical protein